MALLLRIVAGLGVLAGALLLIGFLLPHKAHVERSAVIAAPVCEVYGVMNSFRTFEHWSPWADKDPNMKVSLTGAPAGAGAYYDWAGNNKVGSGSQRITGTTPDAEIDLEVKFEGLDGVSQVHYLFAPEGSGTRVTWAMDVGLGSNLIAPYFGLVMDHQVGPDFEKGLSRLQSFLADKPKLDCASLGVRLIDYAPVAYGLTAGSTTTDADAIAKALTAAYAEIGKIIKSVGLEVKGAPIAISHRWDPEAKVYEFEAGLPVEHLPPPTSGTSSVHFAKTSAGLTLRFEHRGPYTDFKQVYDGIDAYKQLTGLQDRGDSWEEYVSDPGNTPAAELITRIYVPVK